MLSIIEQGGFIMYPLIFMSTISLAIFMERAYLLYLFNKKYRLHFDNLISLVKEGKVNEAKGLTQTLPSVIRDTVLLILTPQSSEDTLRSELDIKMQTSRLEMKKRVWILGTVASASPFIGLFGTVVGIIKSFKSIAISGKGGFSVVAQGLSEALIATASGIFVAVMALIFFNIFNGMFNSIFVHYKIKVTLLINSVLTGVQKGE